MPGKQEVQAKNAQVSAVSFELRQAVYCFCITVDPSPFHQQIGQRWGYCEERMSLRVRQSCDLEAALTCHVTWLRQLLRIATPLRKEIEQDELCGVILMYLNACL